MDMTYSRGVAVVIVGVVVGRGVVVGAGVGGGPWESYIHGYIG